MIRIMSLERKGSFLYQSPSFYVAPTKQLVVNGWADHNTQNAPSFTHIAITDTIMAWRFVYNDTVRCYTIVSDATRLHVVTVAINVF